jgi:hypothetical protein
MSTFENLESEIYLHCLQVQHFLLVSYYCLALLFFATSFPYHDSTQKAL